MLKTKKANLAKLILLTNFSLAVFVATVTTPYDDGGRFYFVPISLLTILIFDLSERKSYLYGLFFPFFCYFVSLNFELQSFLAETKTQHLDADLSKIPGSPLAYWISKNLRDSFRFKKIASLTVGEGNNVTSDNARFVRFWWEISRYKIGRTGKWLPYAKGGPFRKWAGNIEHVVDWSDAARNYYKTHSVARIIPEPFWYRDGITWTDVGGGITGFRYLPKDTTFDATGLTIFLGKPTDIINTLSLLNRKVVNNLLPILNPTLHVQLIDVKAVPVP